MDETVPSPAHVSENAFQKSIQSQNLGESPSSLSLSRRRRRSHFVTDRQILPDFVASSLITQEQALLYFSTFFQGCDHYVPVFDPEFDTFESVKSRSSVLFGAICTIGCRIQMGADSQQWRLLNFQLKRMLNCSLSVTNNASLETVQALLVQACYSAERSLLVATATRLAVDIGLPDAYDDLTSQLSLPNSGRLEDSTSSLMRQTRAWLHLLILGHILHVDAGDLLTFKLAGDARRTRVLLKYKKATVLDRFLLAQVELNVIRANIYSSLSGLVVESAGDEEIMDVVRDSRIDIGLWYSDWERIFYDIRPTPPWLLVNLRVQKCWAETIALCRAVRIAGIDNVDFMSETQKSILSMAKESLGQHLDVILKQPRSYLQNLRFAMDFVWAKCAFCYLLLLKLTVLLPGGSPAWNEDLINSGNVLISELAETGDGSEGGSHTGKMYLQLLKTGIEKFTRAIGEQQKGPHGSAPDETSPGELDEFVPEQFVFEWDFPGLTLFSSSTTGIGWLDDILLGALNGGNDNFGLTGLLNDES